MATTVLTGAQVSPSGYPGPAGGTVFPRGHLKGMRLANNATDAANDIDVSEGECRNSTNTVDFNLPASITKRLDAAWVEGTNQGGLDTGAIANTTYHVFAIRSVTGVCDVLFSISATAPTLPANYTAFRRIGSILRVSAAIKPFLQTGNTFQIASVDDYSSASARSLSLLALSVPSGIRVLPILRAMLAQGTAGTSYMNMAPGDNSALAVVQIVQTNAANTVDNSLINYLSTNLSAQVYVGVTIQVGTLQAGVVTTIGWIDGRGQDD
jgi:hypothetical protein